MLRNGAFRDRPTCEIQQRRAVSSATAMVALRTPRSLGSVQGTDAGATPRRRCCYPLQTGRVVATGANDAIEPVMYMHRSLERLLSDMAAPGTAGRSLKDAERARFHPSHPGPAMSRVPRRWRKAICAPR